MAKTEMTIVQKFNAIAKALADNEITVEGFNAQEFIADRIEKSKSSSSSKGAFNLNDEQKAIVEAVRMVLINAKGGMTVTEMQKASDVLTAFSTSKVTSAITKMTVNADKKPNPNGIFTKAVDKKVSRYCLCAKASNITPTQE